MKCLPLIFMLVTTGPSGASPGAEFIDFRDLGGPYDFSEITGMSADGRILVGTGFVSGVGYEAFVWTRENGFLRLGTLPGGFDSYAKGVSPNGKFVVGHVLSMNDGYPTPFIWSAETGMVPLPRIGNGEQATATDVSSDGRIVVGGADTDETSTLNIQAARWIDGVPSALGDLPGGSVGGEACVTSGDGLKTAGYSLVKDGWWGAYQYTDESGMTNLGSLPTNPYAAEAEAQGMSSDGSYVVGGSRGVGGFEEAFVWSQERGMRSLGNLGNYYDTWGYAVSLDGAVVVGKSGSNAFMWTGKRGILKITTAVERYGLHLSGRRLENATAISDDGTVIVGHGWKGTLPGYHGFLIVLPPGAGQDHDEDGLDDGWENLHFSDLSQTGSDDFDNDGTDNLTELRLNLVPTDQRSKFEATCTRDGKLSWPSVVGTTFKLERSTDLKNWNLVQAAVPGTATSTFYTPLSPKPPSAYYRVTLNE